MRPCRFLWPTGSPPAATGPAPKASRENPASVSWPLGDRRHGRKYAFHIAARAQPEMRAAVVEQIELDIAAAPLGLFVPLFLRPALVHATANDLRLDVQESLAHRLGEGKVAFPVAAVVMVEEDAAHTARLAAMRQPEIGIGPLLVFGEPFLVESVAGLFQPGMEIHRVGMARRTRQIQCRIEIRAAAEPAFGGDDHARVHMYR